MVSQCCSLKLPAGQNPAKRRWIPWWKVKEKICIEDLQARKKEENQISECSKRELNIMGQQTENNGRKKISSGQRSVGLSQCSPREVMLT